MRPELHVVTSFALAALQVHANEAAFPNYTCNLKHMGFNQLVCVLIVKGTLQTVRMSSTPTFLQPTYHSTVQDRGIVSANECP